jgi:hypothetical protein
MEMRRFILQIEIVIVAVIAILVSAADAQVLSTKRGFADVGANYGNLQATGAGWYYTWGTGDGNPGNFDAKHYPMFWSAPGTSTINNTLATEPDYILGFNEPERPDQANMSVATAISSWTNVSNATNAYNAANNTSIKLVSPAVADTGGAAGGQAWLASFMQQAAANSLKVDAVAFHWYGVSTPDNPAGAASSFLSRVASYYNSYQKPVFITEFAIHDWGGNYTDAEIAEANRQFLSIVIPELESRSYVAGYAWYHWFGDAHLYEGNPLTPTPVGFQYIGTIKSGTTYNFSGVNLGEHVAYLGGGELTLNGPAGTVRYINALAGVSTISGTSNWSLGAASNWVRVQPGATLRKSGANQITWNGLSVTNNGTIQVAQGILNWANGVSVAGAGSVRIDAGGTLVVNTNGREATSVNINYPVDLRGGTLSTSMPNGFIALGGSSISGAGTVVGNVTAFSGATIRTSGAGIAAPARFLIDNFESYAAGNVSAVASPPWTAHQNTSLADIEIDSGNKVLTFGWASDFRGTSRDLPENAVIENNETATFFFRFNSKTDDPDHSFGLGDLADTGSVTFSNYETQLRVIDNPSAAGTYMIDARNGGGFTAPLATNLATNAWYNVWMVVNQTTDTYDLYMNTGTANATAANKLNTSPLGFRNGATSGVLNKILGLAGSAPIDNGVRFDDLYYLDGAGTGAELFNPLSGLPTEVMTPATITVQGNVTLSAGATLELNIFSPTNHDVLSVTGSLLAGGTLRVLLDPLAPAPQIGDAFDLFDFASASGAFTSFNLPTLPAGLAWDTNSLLASGTLQVILAGDYNNDGSVDGADFIIWRKTNIHGQAGFDAWRENFGRTAGSGAASEMVPEPHSVLVLSIAFATGLSTRARRRRQRARSVVE